jgi:hypothetical protein
MSLFCPSYSDYNSISHNIPGPYASVHSFHIDDSNRTASTSARAAFSPALAQRVYGTNYLCLLEGDDVSHASFQIIEPSVYLGSVCVELRA